MGLTHRRSAFALWHNFIGTHWLALAGRIKVELFGPKFFASRAGLSVPLPGPRGPRTSPCQTGSRNLRRGPSGPRVGFTPTSRHHGSPPRGEFSLVAQALSRLGRTMGLRLNNRYYSTEPLLNRTSTSRCNPAQRRSRAGRYSGPFRLVVSQLPRARPLVSQTTSVSTPRRSGPVSYAVKNGRKGSEQTALFLCPFERVFIVLSQITTGA